MRISFSFQQAAAAQQVGLEVADDVVKANAEDQKEDQAQQQGRQQDTAPGGFAEGQAGDDEGAHLEASIGAHDLDEQVFQGDVLRAQGEDFGALLHQVAVDGRQVGLALHGQGQMLVVQAHVLPPGG